MVVSGGVFQNGAKGFDDFLIEADDGVVTAISGSISTMFGASFGDRFTNIDSYQGFFNDSTIELINVTIAEELDLTGPSQTASIGFEVISGRTSGQQITVETQTESESDGVRDFYAIGALAATAEDGSSLMLLADTGDKTTFQLVITDSMGTVTSELIDWTSAFALPCLTDEVDRPGFLSFCNPG